MSIELFLSNGGPLNFLPGLPATYTGPILPGAIARSVKTNTAQVVVQEIAGDSYFMRLSVGRFLTRVSIKGQLKKSGLYSHFMLKSSIRKEIDRIGKLHIREGHFASFFSDEAECNARFEKNTEYRSLDFFYTPKMLEEISVLFPELKMALSRGLQSMLFGRPGWMIPSMREITHQLLNCRLDAATARFYFDLKIRELLLQVMVNAYQREPDEKNYTIWEIARIHDAKNILLTYISEKPPSLKELSKQVTMNSFKLKAGFRQFFHAGIFEWLHDQKMQVAKELLFNSNKQIKEIGVMVGYPHTTNFITAFRRHFGCSPGALRRK